MRFAYCALRGLLQCDLPDDPGREFVEKCNASAVTRDVLTKPVGRNKRSALRRMLAPNANHRSSTPFPFRHPNAVDTRRPSPIAETLKKANQ